MITIPETTETRRKFDEAVANLLEKSLGMFVHARRAIGPPILSGETEMKAEALYAYCTAVVWSSFRLGLSQDDCEKVLSRILDDIKKYMGGSG